MENSASPAQSAKAGTALIIIDMQKDFVLPSSPACVAGAEGSVPTIANLLRQARGWGWPVFHVVRQHAPDGSDAEPYRRPLFQQGKGICVAGSEGAEIVPELAPLPGEIILPKTRFSAFYHTNLEGILRGMGIHSLVLAGTQYPNCIRGSAMDALYRDFRVVLVTDACSAASPGIAEANIQDMRGMGMLCVTLAELEDALAGKLPA